MKKFMLKNNPAFSSFSVTDIEETKTFYVETLGLETRQTPEGLKVQVQGLGELFLYSKPNHVPATYTVLNFLTDNIDETVDGLIAAGVKFEQYDMKYMKTDEKGISRNPTDMGPKAMAWFTDPSGNILSVLQEK